MPTSAASGVVTEKQIDYEAVITKSILAQTLREDLQHLQKKHGESATRC
jgi:hypothetical protein